MAVVKILVDGKELENITPPVNIHLDCTGFHEIKYIMDNGVVKSGTFSDCDINSVIIGEGINEIESDAFKTSKVEDIQFEGSNLPTVEEDSFPSNAIVTARLDNDESIETIKQMFGYDWIPSTRANKVGDILYEMDGGGIYVAPYSEDNTDTPLAICVIPTGMYSDKAHFIGLSDIVYKNDGTVKEITNENDDEFMYWAPYRNGYFSSNQITYFSQVPYIGLFCKNGEEEEQVKYPSEEAMPGIITESRTSYTTDTHLLMDPELKTLSFADKSRNHSIECSFMGDYYYPAIPGSVEVLNPYDLGTKYCQCAVRPVLYLDSVNGNYWKFSKTYLAPSPYINTTGNALLVNKNITKACTGIGVMDNGNPFSVLGSANSLLLGRIIIPTNKPSYSETDNPLVYGTSSGSLFFPAPHCAYDYSPASGWTEHEWALGTPLEWLCTFSRLDKVNELLEKLGGQTIINNFYWTGIFANSGQVYVASGGTRELDSLTTSHPRFRARPFIVI